MEEAAELFSHLLSPIEYDEYTVWESRDPYELLILQDLMLTKGLEGFDEVVLPRTASGGELDLPFGRTAFMVGDREVALLAQAQTNPMATPLQRTKARLLRW